MRSLRSVQAEELRTERSEDAEESLPVDGGCSSFLSSQFQFERQLKRKPFKYSSPVRRQPSVQHRMYTTHRNLEAMSQWPTQRVGFNGLCSHKLKDKPCRNTESVIAE